ncbi:glycosyltransferase [Halovivax ruber XH-70]|uniref:Glycosyltransferase n=1 Tax=Halovivax ruber (strain DSM 18193 / JCM 13892 / XH-70) TaxID=797302 RepID=L0I9W9_HALRX|nr:glycosyltransferase family 4 protein [Halovivax ruber]AGB15623.1 glycosyltransferase [Halovivax ruber XH-70]
MNDDIRNSILYITHHYPPETGAGATRADELSKRWATSGDDVTILTSVPHYPEGTVDSAYTNGWIQRENRGDVSAVYLKTFGVSPDDSFIKRGLEAIWFAVFSTLVGLWLGRFDTVLATCPQPLTGLSGWVISSVRRSTFIYEVRDLWPESLVATGSDPGHPAIRTLDATTNFIYRRADAIVVVAEGMTDVVVSAGAHHDDVYVHRNGIDPSFFEGQQSDVAVCEGDVELSEAFVVSYIGTVGAAQGIDVLLDVAEQLESAEEHDDIVFALVGFGDQYDTLRREATERNLANMIFYGKRPKAEVPAFLEVTDVSFVHLLKRDLFEYAIPSKIFEAMVAGNPIVLGVQGEAARIVSDAEAGIPVTPEDPDAIREAILELYEDQDEREARGSNGASYVLNHFTWDAISDAYRETINTVMVNNRR